MVSSESRFLYILSDILGRHGVSIVPEQSPVGRHRLRFNFKGPMVWHANGYLFYRFDGTTAGYYATDCNAIINDAGCEPTRRKAATSEQMFWLELSSLLRHGACLSVTMHPILGLCTRLMVDTIVFPREAWLTSDRLFGILDAESCKRSAKNWILDQPVRNPLWNGWNVS